jgi:hypothetical protein
MRVGDDVCVMRACANPSLLREPGPLRKTVPFGVFR